MTALKAHEVGRFVQRPDLSEGIFLAYGTDGGLVRETAQRLARGFAGSADEVVVLEGALLDAEPGRLVVEARMSSLFGEKRVIRVRNAGKGLVMPLSELKDDPGGTAIILEAGNLTPKDPLRALVEAARFGRDLPCYPDTEETLATLVRETFSKAQVRLEPDVVPTLRDLLGNDREITRRELDKLVLYAQSSGTLSRAEVLNLCGDNAALAIDEILDAIGTGHRERLEAALSRAFVSAIDPQQLLTMALRHFAALRRLRVEVDAGRSAREVLQNARPRPHFSRLAAMEQQLRLWSDPMLAGAGERLLLATAESRKRPALGESLLRRAFFALCGLAAQA